MKRMKFQNTVARHKGLFIGLLLLFLAAWLSLRIMSGFSGETAMDPGDTVVVGRGSFSLKVIERGVVKPARISPISSQISSNQAKLVWMVPEGTHVEKGMLVARFDTKPFMDSLEKAEQAYSDAQATLVASEKLLTLQEEEEAGKVEEAERKLEIARIDAENTRKGSGPLKRKILEQKVSQAERSLEIQQSELDDLNVLLEKGHISSRERDKVVDKVDAAKEQLTVANAELESFDRYVWPQMVREAELLISGAESSLDRVRRTAEILVATRKSEVEKNRRNIASKLNTLNQAREDIVHCDLYAPTDGILLYAELPREGKRRKVQIGDSVWVGQTFLEVPDTTELVAEIFVREVDVANIRTGMRTVIEVDAFPGQTFTGEVERIDSLAQDDSGMGNARQFRTRRRITGRAESVFVGMSVTAKIIFKEVKDVLVVPISSIAYRGEKTFVRKNDGKTFIPIEVRTGARGELVVEILDGLMDGDVVLRKGV